MASAHLLHMVYERTRAGGATEDIAMTTHQFYVDAATWPAAAPANYETAETFVIGFWTALKPYYHSTTSLKELRWYREDDLSPPWGAVARMTPVGAAGTVSGADQLPPQVALSVTERTAYTEVENGRHIRHWGRFYLPAPSEAANDSDGTVTNGFKNAVATAVDDMYAGLTTTGLVPSVLISGWGASIPDGGWTPVRHIAVDNLWDTIRRRRYETVTAREVKDVWTGDD